MKMPLMLDMKNKKVLIIGGGKIGGRKASTFLRYGALVTCISPELDDSFSSLDVNHIKGYYQDDLDGFDIIVAATDDYDLNGRIYKKAHEMKKLCMTVDHINPSDFDFMAVRQKRDLTIAVSTGGGSPGFSKEIVSSLMKSVSSEDLDSLETMIKKRRERLNQI